MVNTNIQGMVPLNGRGFTNNPFALDEPGVYSEFRNVNLNNDRIEGRPAIRSFVNDYGVAAAPMTTPERIIGEVDGSTYFSNRAGDVYRMPSSGVFSLARANSGSFTFSAAFSENFHLVVGAFEYNDKAYYLTYKHERDAAFVGTHTFYLWQWTSVTNPAVIGAAVSVLVVTTPDITGKFTLSPEFFRGFFIFKERLWLTLATGLYCSKATDPLIFTPSAGNGFFLRIRDQEVTCAFVNADSIYVMSEFAINLLTYDADPNTSAYVRPVSVSQGGIWGISHLGNVYVLSHNTLYTLANGYLDVVRDDFIYQKRNIGSFDLIGAPDELTHGKIVSFGKYLIIIKYSRYASTLSRTKSYNTSEALVPSINSVFMFNTDNGSMSVLDFSDQINGNYRGYIVDALYVSKAKAVYLMTCRKDAASAFKGIGYVMYESMYFNSLDYTLDTNSLIKAKKPNVVVEMEDYSPDGSEYQVKKFRSMDFEGVVPVLDAQLNVAFDDKDYPAQAIDISMSVAQLEAAGTARFAHPFRIGINQRARSLSFKFLTANADTLYDVSAAMLDGTYDYSTFVLEKIRFLWTYTQRPTTTKSPTNVS